MLASKGLHIQVTDFENAAYVAFVVLISRAILDLRLDLRIPMSKVHENMDRAAERNAALEQEFWFPCSVQGRKGEDEDWRPMSLDEIMNGSTVSGFPGLIPLARSWLASKNASAEVQEKLDAYFDLIGGRASGRYPTTAAWIRRFVARHADYASDSRVSDHTAYDLLSCLRDLSARESHVAGVFPLK